MYNLKHTKEKLKNAIKKSSSWREVCLKLKIDPLSGAQAYLKRTAVKNELSFNHFPGKGQKKGTKFKIRKSINEYLEGNFFITSHKLKIKLIKEGIKKHQCEQCKKKTWRGFLIPIELHHRDSNHENNKLENLEILCPNCHAQEGKKNKINAHK